MKGRTWYSMIAELLTIPSAVVTVHSGVAIWKAWPEDIWDCEFLVLLASLGISSLVNVWVQAIFGSGVSLGGRTMEWGRRTTPIPVEVRGHGDV